MPIKPHNHEKEFFAREELEKKHRLHEKQKSEVASKDLEERKKVHFMKCSKCGDDLKTIRVSFVDIEECPSCGAMVLDKGELAKLKTADNSILKSLLEVFKKDN